MDIQGNAPGFSALTQRQTVAAVNALVARFALPPLDVRWSERLRRGWYYPVHEVRDRLVAQIRVGPKCHVGNTESCVLHEVAHHLDHVEYAHAKHSASFVLALVRVIAEWHGSSHGPYDWAHEYACVQREWNARYLFNAPRAALGVAIRPAILDPLGSLRAVAERNIR